MKSITTEVCTFDEISVDLISFSAVAVFICFCACPYGQLLVVCIELVRRFSEDNNLKDKAEEHAPSSPEH